MYYMDVRHYYHECDEEHETLCQVQYYCSGCFSTVSRFIELCDPFNYLARSNVNHLSVVNPLKGITDHRTLTRKFSKQSIRESLRRRLDDRPPHLLMDNRELLYYAKEERVLMGAWTIYCHDIPTLRVFWNAFATGFYYWNNDGEYLEVKCQLVENQDRSWGGVISIVNEDFKDFNAMGKIVAKIRELAFNNGLPNQMMYYEPKFFWEVGVLNRHQDQYVQTFIYTSSFNYFDPMLMFSVGVRDFLVFYGYVREL